MQVVGRIYGVCPQGGTYLTCKECTGLGGTFIDKCTCQQCPDRDQDGYKDYACGGDDCNDFDFYVHPYFTLDCSEPDYELTNHDRNCNGQDDYFDCYSPVLIDVLGDGFELSDGPGGVLFDLTADGNAERLAWTVEGSDDSWLALDRNGNGSVDHGQELFGNFTPQPAPPPGQSRNGFLALAEYDTPENGGNRDGVIDAVDAVYTSLRLWRDADHNGVSEPGELLTLPSANVGSISLDYRESRRRDQHGNLFRYRAQVNGHGRAGVGRWAYDVFLVSGR